MGADVAERWASARRVYERAEDAAKKDPLGHGDLEL